MKVYEKFLEVKKDGTTYIEKTTESWLTLYDLVFWCFFF